jgi:DNA-binding XRE family transcriptional regulator
MGNRKVKVVERMPIGAPQPEIERVELNEKEFYDGLREKVRKLRFDRGMTQGTLAKALGMKPVAVSRMENETMMTVAQLYKVHKIYGVPVSDLLEVKKLEASNDDGNE